MKYLIRPAYWLWRTPRGQALVLLVLLFAGAYFAFRDLKDPTDKLAVAAALGAAFVAIWGVVNQWGISRRQLTVQFMRELETDHDYIGALRIFNAAARERAGLVQFAKTPPMDPAERTKFEEDAQAVWLVLNQDELIAIGIKNSILDYRVVCMLARNAIQQRYNHSRYLIEQMRTNLPLPTMYLELERLADRLKNDDFHSIL